MSERTKPLVAKQGSTDARAPAASEDIKPAPRLRDAESEIRGNFEAPLDVFLSPVLRGTAQVLSGNPGRQIYDSEYGKFKRLTGIAERRLLSEYRPEIYDLGVNEFFDRVMRWKRDSNYLAGSALQVYNYWMNDNSHQETPHYILNSALEHKIELINRFAKYARNEQNVAKYIATLFPNLQFVGPSNARDSAPAEAQPTETISTKEDNSNRDPLPLSAPALWKADKLAHETPPDFIKRIYGEWLGNGLDRATVRRLDPNLGQALDNWLRKNEMPADVDLPTAKERSAREIEQLRSHSKTGDINDVVGNFTLKEAQRIAANIRRHEKKQK